ncbi:C-type lectin protein [Leptodontidium sp. MPI-SDFR-AT-0119]|nr:C-type lectin protein [Leptodontidium sp. MPI-SDFR-AT-0119]
MAPASTTYSGAQYIEVKGIQKRKAFENIATPAVLHPEMAVPKVDIIDIRHDAVELSLKDEILNSLNPQEGPKRLPTLLLYDERGLQLFEEITYLEEYYLTNAEIDVLRNSARNIAEAIPSGSMVVELGSGNLRKVSILLEALDSAGKDIDYYALDLSLKELYRTLEQVPEFKHVKCHGLHGTYDDGLDWLKTPENIDRPKCVMSLGSSIGNFSREGSAKFLKGFSDMLQSEDSMLVGLDATSDPAKVYHAYNDREGITHKFILNGLANANDIYKEQVFELEDWRVIGEYVFDAEGGRHQAFCSPVHDVNIKGVDIKAGERIQIEESLKYSPEGAAQLWKASGLVEADRMSASSDAYSLHLLKRNMAFKTDPSLYAASTVPTMEDWKGLWSVWDLVTRGMIPDAELNEKPIKLRNACIFYLGHIPTFVDIQLTKATKQPMCEPSYYPKIFERGIDPDVDNPERCHDHSEVPEEWPPVEEILVYQKQVRVKIEKLTTAKYVPRDIGRSLWIGFEHEIMHLETLLYMLLQSDKTLPPSKFKPDFEGMAALAETAKVDNEWFDIPEQRITIGLNDPEDNSGGDNHFGWDNEKPPRSVVVPAFKAQARAITNEDYARYLEQTHNSSIPASWAAEKANLGQANGHSDGASNGYSNGHAANKSLSLTKAYLEGKSVRTVYGLVPLNLALDWPVFASFDELAGCAKWMDGRIPTFEEARSIYSHVDGLRRKEAEQHLGKTVPAVNGHLVNDGVQESPPSLTSQTGESSQELFTNLENANVGFKHWHPVAITANGDKLAGQADMGGVWEWTSSPLDRYEGFEPMKLYPAYTADFFDGKHNIVLGGSWATHPRIAGRKTFVNWYQRNYPYAWAGARLVRDL